MSKSEKRRTPSEAPKKAAPSPTAESSLLQTWKWTLLTLALVGGAVIIVYGRAIDSPFIFDDQMSVVTNPSIVRLWPLVGDEENPGPLNPPKDLPTAGRPLVNLSFAVNYQISELQPRSYHILNIIVHILSAVLLGAIVRRTLELDYFQGSFDRAAGPLSVAVALLWALHPLQTESVIYVTQRTELFMGFCYLATLYCSLRYWTVAPQRKTLWLVLATLSCLTGMACKEVMVTAPVVMLLYERTFLAGGFREALRRSWPLYVGLALGWMVLFALNISQPRSQSAGFHHQEVTAFQWWLTQTKILLMYLKLTVWPWPLVIHYGTPYITSVGDALPFLLPVLLLAGLTIYLLWRNSPLGFLLAWIWLILSPTLVVPIVTEVAAERRMYLPLAALMSLLVVGGYRLAQYAGRTMAKPSTAGRGSVAGIALLTFGMIAGSSRICFSQPDNFSDDFDLRHPSADPVQAVENFKRSLWCTPTSADSCNSRGATLAGQERFDEAIAQFELALVDQPQFAEGHYNLAKALFKNEERERGLEHLRLAMALKPRSIRFQNACGTALLNVGQSRAALRCFQEITRIQPDHTQAWINIASAQIQLRHNAEAMDAGRKALELARSQGNEDTAERLEGWLRLLSGDPALSATTR
jgi:tetratricopeptide (TPR) repeat protein